MAEKRLIRENIQYSNYIILAFFMEISNVQIILGV